MHAGWQGHAIGLAFFDNYLVYTNTWDNYNIFDKYSGSFIIPINNADIAEIQSIFRPANEYLKTIKQMQRQFPEIYRLINNPDEKSCIYLPQKPQKRGNCTKSNPLKNYKALILLQEAKAKNRHNSIEELSGFYRENELSITAKYKGLSQHIREEALKRIDFSISDSMDFSLANQYMLQHRNSQKPFYKSAVKYILQKQLESDGYTTTQVENSLQSKSGETNTASVTLSDEQVEAFITGLKNNPYILTSEELNVQRHLFFSSGSINEAELLTKDETGNTPLHTLIQEKAIGKVIVVIDYLLSQDGLLERNLAIANDLGKTPLDYINETLLEYTNGREQETLLHFATGLSDSKLFDFLLEQKGIDVNVLDLNYITPLEIATKNRDHTRMIALLTKQSITSQQSLIIAVTNGDITAINILLEYGAEININYNSTNNPLHAAIISKNLEIINLLLTQIQEQGQGDLVKYILDDCNSQEPFYKSAVKYILQKQLESDGYNITQAENSLESKSEAANTANITLSDEQVELFITGLKNNPNILTTAEYDFQCHLFAKSIGLTNPRDYVAEFKYDSLHSAIKDSSNSVAIKHLFFSSGSINEELLTKDEKGNTPLHTAIQKEDFGTVILLTQYLSQEGLLKRNLSITNNLGKTPLEHINEQGLYLLHTAIQTNKSVFKYLFNDLYLESKVINEVINVKNESGNTLLHFETVLTDSDLLSFLLDQEIVVDNIDIRNSGGDTPLCTLINNLCLLKGSLSTSEKMEEIIKLLSNGADINNLNENKDSVLHLIISLSPSYGKLRKHVIIKDIGRKKEILLNGSLNHQNFNGDTPLHVAARGGDVEYVKLLLSYGAQTDIYNKDGKTFIDIAIETLASFSNQGEEYRFFNRVINNIRSPSSGTPLCTLIKNNISKCRLFDLVKDIIELLSYGADINNLNENKDSVLHLIISLSPSYDKLRKDCIIIYIENKKEILLNGSLNHRNVNGDTPLHVAARGGDVEYVKLLLSYGAQTDIYNKDGKTFIDIARETLDSFSNQGEEYMFFNDIINQYSDAKSIDSAVRPTPSSAIQEPAIAATPSELVSITPGEVVSTTPDAKTFTPSN